MSCSTVVIVSDLTCGIVVCLVLDCVYRTCHCIVVTIVFVSYKCSCC